MDDVADFIARHAVLVLNAVVVIVLLLSGIVWRIVTKLGPRSWAVMRDLWDFARRSRLADRLRAVPLLGRLIVGTLTAARYLGIIAILGFAIAAAAIVAFFELADEIGIGESLATFDNALSDALRRHVSLDTLQAFAMITHLGDLEFLVVIGTIVFVGLLLARKRLLAAMWAIGTIGGSLLNSTLKTIFERSRPVHEHELTTVTSWSFPSGHASGSVLVYALLVYMIVRHTPARWHIPVALTGIALIVYVGSSRVLLQVHYLSDVLAGYASAGAWISICIGALEAVRWREARSGRGQPIK